MLNAFASWINICRNNYNFKWPLESFEFYFLAWTLSPLMLNKIFYILFVRSETFHTPPETHKTEWLNLFNRFFFVKLDPLSIPWASQRDEFKLNLFPRISNTSPYSQIKFGSPQIFRNISSKDELNGLLIMKTLFIIKAVFSGRSQQLQLFTSN